MNHFNTIHTTFYTVMLIVCCITFAACNTQDNSATFSGKLIDVEGKPIAGHIVTLYPVQMSDSGSVIYQPIMTIAASPGFLTARTNKEGVFTFTEDIDPGMIRLGLIPSKTLDKIRKPNMKEYDLKSEYDLVSVKIGAMTFYADDHGPGTTTFSLQTDRKIQNVVVVARPEMWIEGKIVFADRKPLSNAPVLLKVESRKQDKTGGLSYGDRIHNTDSKGNFLYGLFYYHNEPKLYKVSVEYQELSAASEEFLIQGGSHYKGLTLMLNGDSNDIPDNPKPLEQPTLPGMMPLSKKITPEQWIVNPTNGHAYIRIICQNLEVAKDQAAAERAYLVAINDKVEQEWLSGVFGNELYWIGLHKDETKGQWQWDNGEPLTYTNWGPEDRFKRDFISEGEKTAGIITFVDGEWHAIAPGDLFWNVTQMALLEKDDSRVSTTSEDR
jgi:hypothetical protein